MAFISTISDDEAEGPAAEMYARDRAQMGYVANYTRAFARRPAVFEAWRQLNKSIRGGMDLRRYELATFAAAGACGRATARWPTARCSSTGSWIPRRCGGSSRTPSRPTSTRSTLR